MMSLREQCNPRVLELLDLLGGAVYGLMENPRESLVRIIVDRLEKMEGGTEAETMVIRQMACHLKADVFRDLERYDEAITLYRKARALREPEEQPGCVENAAVVRTLFDKGEPTEGYREIARNVLESIRSGVEQSFIRVHLLLAEFADPSAAMNEMEYQTALAEYVTTFLHVPRDEITALIDSDPMKAFRLVQEETD